MSVTCLMSNLANDLRCPVCGQGFLVFAERGSATVREQVKRRVQHTMRSHHAGAMGGLHVHPTTAFAVEEAHAGACDGLSNWLPANIPGAALTL